jgi:hypothetical protein
MADMFDPTGGYYSYYSRIFIAAGNLLRSAKSDYGYYFLIPDTKKSARYQIVRLGKLGAARFHSRHPQSNECSDVRKEELQLPSSHFVPSIQ